jgi:DNA-binding MarR family transcriptional regulator
LSAALQDERTRLMRMVVQTHRQLSDTLGRELQQAVGISPVFFDVLIHVAAAPGERLTMSRLSAEVALTTSGVTRLVDRMVGAGLVDRENSSKDRRSIQVVLTKQDERHSHKPSLCTSRASSATFSHR